MAFLALLLSPEFLSSCRKEDLFEDVKYNGRIIIIGAGAAGLYAGYILKSRGIDFMILEASDQYGGRLAKRDDFADFPIDLGAQWLHGRNNILGSLIAETKTKTSLDESENFFWFKNAVTDSVPSNVEDILSPDAEAADISYLDFAQQKGLGEDYRCIIEQIAGDFGADATDLSIKWTDTEEEEWVSGDDDFKFEKTFYDLLNDHIVPTVAANIELNTVVSSIDYSSERITVTDQDGNSFDAGKVIITTPVTVLQDGDINFTPALPASKVAAFNRIGMGPGMKVFLKFSEKFYKENLAGGKVCAAYADDSVGKTGKDNVLLAFIMGQQAATLSALGSDLAITNAILEELDTIYDGQATASFISSHVEDWTTNPYVRGAYSYSKVGIGDARTVAAEALNDRLFFAGEAMNTSGHHASVHGAVETGYRAVMQILASEQK